MARWISVFMIFFAFLALASEIHAGEEVNLPKGLKGISIGGVWYLSYQAGTTHGTDGHDYNLFKVKRGYINIKKEINSWLSGRITPDTHQDDSGDYKVRLKYAYADFQIPTAGLFYKPHVEWGLVHRTWLDFEEHINYYRLQDTMFLERNDLINSADLGVTFFALLGGEMSEEYKHRVNSKYPGRFGSLAIGLYNGGGYHAKEKNNQKEPELRLTLRPLPDVFPGLQLSYFGVIAHGNTADAPDWNINAGFLSLEDYRYTLTATYYQGKGNKGGEVDAGGLAKEKDGYSFFGELKIPENNVSFIGRYDWFDSDKNVDDDEQTRLIFGVAYHLAGHSMILIDYDLVCYAEASRDDDPRGQITTEIHF